MPVGANRPGKHGGLGGTKPSREKADETKADAKDPESPSKIKSPTAAKSSATDAKPRSQSGLTAEEHFHELRVRVKSAGGPDIKTTGWTCKLVPSPKAEGAATAGDALDPCFVEPETGKEFLKRKNVLKHLGLSDPKKVTREDAAHASRESFKERNKEEPLPQKIGEVTVLQWGKVAPERESFHTARYIWPIGFKSMWVDEDQKDVEYVSEIRDGMEESGAPDGLCKIDAPIFVVGVTRKGEDKPTEFFGKNGKQVWRRATRDDNCKDHTGLRDEEVCKRLEGLKHAAACKNYEFIATREVRLVFDDEESQKKKKKKKSANGDAGSGGKVAGRKRKAESEPKKELLKAKRAREREEKAKEKAKEKEDKERKQQAAAEERQAREEEARERKRLAREEEARERKRQKELQEIEQKWHSRYPIEDLAIALEDRAMKAAEEEGCDVAAQRAAARAVVDAVERGYGQAACLAAGKEAAESRAAGDTDEEAQEKACLRGEEVHQANLDAPYAGMDADDQCSEDDERKWRMGTRARMLFKTGEGEQKFTGFVSKFSDDTKNMFIDFYDENDPVEVPCGDPDVEFLAPGEALRLPPSVEKPQLAPVHAGDLLTVARFVDAFRAELKIPKGNLNDLQDGLEDPANSDFLAQLYQALLIGAMEASNAIVPAVWEGDNTLTNHTWPEIARRWITCGSHAELNKRRFPEAVAAATCLSAAPGGATSRPEGHLKLLLCLMEDCLDHPDIHTCVESRLERADEATKIRDEKAKDYFKEHKILQEKLKAAKEAVSRADAGDDKADAEPLPDEATKRAMEKANAEAGEAGNEMVESVGDKALRVAFEEKHAEWKQRREERGGKAADKELQDLLKQEKRLDEGYKKSEADYMTKLEKFCFRQAPLGLDRYRNRYWWFPADAATLYVEPPNVEPPIVEPPLPRHERASDSSEWRKWCGVEAMTKLASCLNEKGARESELKNGIMRVIEKIGSSSVEGQEQSTVREQLTVKGATEVKFYESFEYAQQEARNVQEVLNPEQQKMLLKEVPGWETIMQNPTGCDQTAQLLLGLELAVHESLAHTKRTKRAAASNSVRPDTAKPGSSAQNGSLGTDGINAEDAGDDSAEWQKDNEHVNHRVRRNVLGEDGQHAGKANGTIVGYLPKEKSDFKSKQTHQDAALWRVKFDDPEMGGGVEDLEEYEVLQAIQDYKEMQASLQSAASLRGGVVPARIEAGENSTSETAAVGSEIFYDEGAIDMAEASNKVTGALWTSAMQREAWRRELDSAARANSVVRICYSASVLCENVLRVMSKTRNDLSSAPRRTRTERGKRSREVAELVSATFTGYTESGRRVKRVNYSENHQHDSDSE